MFILSQIEGEDWNSNKLLNVTCCTLKYNLLNWPTIAYMVTKRYDNYTNHIR